MDYVVSQFRALGHVLETECEAGPDLDRALDHLEIAMLHACRSLG